MTRPCLGALRRYRPIYVHRLEAALDNDGGLVGWRHRIVGQSIVTGTAFAAVRVKNGIDRTSVEGAANLPMPCPIWRSN
jgi:isoquinoline 1-oxidoreductase subunit beta